MAASLRSGFAACAMTLALLTMPAAASTEPAADPSGDGGCGITAHKYPDTADTIVTITCPYDPDLVIDHITIRANGCPSEAGIEHLIPAERQSTFIKYTNEDGDEFMMKEERVTDVMEHSGAFCDIDALARPCDEPSCGERDIVIDFDLQATGTTQRTVDPFVFDESADLELERSISGQTPILYGVSMPPDDQPSDDDIIDYDFVGRPIEYSKNYLPPAQRAAFHAQHAERKATANGKFLSYTIYGQAVSNNLDAIIEEEVVSTNDAIAATAVQLGHSSDLRYSRAMGTQATNINSHWYAVFTESACGAEQAAEITIRIHHGFERVGEHIEYVAVNAPCPDIGTAGLVVPELALSKEQCTLMATSDPMSRYCRVGAVITAIHNETQRYWRNEVNSIAYGVQPTGGEATWTTMYDDGSLIHTDPGHALTGALEIKSLGRQIVNKVDFVMSPTALHAAGSGLSGNGKFISKITMTAFLPDRRLTEEDEAYRRNLRARGAIEDAHGNMQLEISATFDIEASSSTDAIDVGISDIQGSGAVYQPPPGPSGSHSGSQIDDGSIGSASGGGQQTNPQPEGGEGQGGGGLIAGGIIGGILLVAGAFVIYKVSRDKESAAAAATASAAGGQSAPATELHDIRTVQ